jgi:hypothetical protein
MFDIDDSAEETPFSRSAIDFEALAQASGKHGQVSRQAQVCR